MCAAVDELWNTDPDKVPNGDEQAEADEFNDTELEEDVFGERGPRGGRRKRKQMVTWNKENLTSTATYLDEHADALKNGISKHKWCEIMQKELASYQNLHITHLFRTVFGGSNGSNKPAIVGWIPYRLNQWKRRVVGTGRDRDEFERRLDSLISKMKGYEFDKAGNSADARMIAEQEQAKAAYRASWIKSATSALDPANPANVTTMGSKRRQALEFEDRSKARTLGYVQLLIDASDKQAKLQADRDEARLNEKRRQFELDMDFRRQQMEQQAGGGSALVDVEKRVSSIETNMTEIKAGQAAMMAFLQEKLAKDSHSNGSGSETPAAESGDGN